MKILHYLENNYFTTTVISKILENNYTEPEKAAYQQTLTLYQSLSEEELNSNNEADLKHKFISKVLEILGYSFSSEYPFSIQSKQYTLDYLLFRNKSQQQEFFQLKKSAQLEHLSECLLCEAKATTQKLDTNKADLVNNPHYQVINYLINSGISYGFLTNAKYFRLYDATTKFANKVYLQIDLYSALKDENIEAFILFYRVFQSEFYFRKPTPVESDLLSTNTISQTKNVQKQKITDIENRLIDVLYGNDKNSDEDSILEVVGQCVYNYHTQNKSLQTLGTHTLKTLFSDSITFMFRLVFLFYYESKFKTLLKKHQAYDNYSIYKFYEKYILTAEQRPSEYNIYGALIEYFRYLSVGNINLEIPMLNGGLFALDKAVSLNHKGIFTNEVMRTIFKQMLIYKESDLPYQKNDLPSVPSIKNSLKYPLQAPNSSASSSSVSSLAISDAVLSTPPATTTLPTSLQLQLLTTQNDFSGIDIKKLGEIYENLLQYEFRLASKDTYLIAYRENKAEIVTFADNLDLALKKDFKHVTECRNRKYPEGSVYLVSLSNTRKQTASYYTPESLTKFMVADSIANQQKLGKSLHKLQIIDNACGSGHFLVDTLQILTEKVLLEFASTANWAEDTKGEATVEVIGGKDTTTNSMESSTERIGGNANIRELIAEEKAKIIENLKELGFRDPKSQEEFLDEGQILKRILLKKCVFGLDYNALAIEITKLALWIETFIFGTPLSFIEHHIKQGNSLIGTTVDRFRAELKQEPQLDLWCKEAEEKLAKLEENYKQLINLKDTTVEEALKSKEIYNNQIAPKTQEVNLLLNIINYCDFRNANRLAYGIKGKAGAELEILANNKIKRKIAKVKNSSTIFKIYMDKENPDSELHKAVEDFVATYLPFNYEVEFPDSRGNFDIVIGNPPWEETAYNDNDFFSQYNTAYRKMSIESKKAVQEKYLKDPSYNWVKAHYDINKAFLQSYNNYLKSNFPLNSGAGDNNLFKFFIENNLGLLRTTGVLNLVTPSLLTYSQGSIKLRQHLLEEYQLNYCYQFENRQKIFINVHSSYKFVIFSLNHKSTEANLVDEPIKFRFMEVNPSILKTDENIIELTLQQIKTISPESLAILELKTRQDLTIITKMYNLYERIGKNTIKFSNELHMTQHRKLMQEQAITKDYVKFGRELDMTNHRKIMQEQTLTNSLVLYEGKTIHQFNLNFSLPKYFVNKMDLETVEKSKELHRMKQHISKEKLQFFPQEEITQAISYNYQYYRLAFRTIARNTDERTLISTILPKNSTYGNSLAATIPIHYYLDKSNAKIIVVPSYSLAQIFFLNSVLNSIVIDFIIRKYIDMNVNLIYFKQIPIPKPTTAEILASEQYQKLMENALLLNYLHAPEHFSDAAKELNIDLSLVPTSSSNKEKFRCTKMLENDCIVAALYKITLAELEFILTTFPVFNKNQPAYQEQLLQAYAKYPTS